MTTAAWLIGIVIGVAATLLVTVLAIASRNQALTPPDGRARRDLYFQSAQRRRLRRLWSLGGPLS